MGQGVLPRLADVLRHSLQLRALLLPPDLAPLFRERRLRQRGPLHAAVGVLDHPDRAHLAAATGGVALQEQGLLLVDVYLYAAL